jgi:hypothetical protein
MLVWSDIFENVLEVAVNYRNSTHMCNKFSKIGTFKFYCEKSFFLLDSSGFLGYLNKFWSEFYCVWNTIFGMSTHLHIGSRILCLIVFGMLVGVPKTSLIF